MFPSMLKRIAMLTMLVVLASMVSAVFAGGGSLDSFAFPYATAQDCSYWQASGSLSTSAPVSYTVSDANGIIVSEGSVSAVQGSLIGQFSTRPTLNPLHLMAYSGTTLVADLYANNPCVMLPIQITPTPTMTPIPGSTPLPPVACEGAPQTRLFIGMDARVTPGSPNALRNRPGLRRDGSRIIGYIPGSGEFSVVDGPICASGYLWWKVDYNGAIGWTAEGQGNTYWLEPLS